MKSRDRIDRRGTALAIHGNPGRPRSFRGLTGEDLSFLHLTTAVQHSLETQRAGAVLHRPASICSELPGLDSNQDKESQNHIVLICNDLQQNDLCAEVPSRCTAGRTQSKRESEGGIVDADLAAIVEAWPTLPATIRAALLAVVRSADRGQ